MCTSCGEALTVCESRQYASYWNAFLFIFLLQVEKRFPGRRTYDDINVYLIQTTCRNERKRVIKKSDGTSHDADFQMSIILPLPLTATSEIECIPLHKPS